MKFQDLRPGTAYRLKHFLHAIYLGERFSTERRLMFILSDGEKIYRDLEDVVEEINNFGRDLIYKDPETDEELRFFKDPETSGNGTVLYMENKDGTRRWKHTILTEQI